MAISKVILNGTTLMDVTTDTVTADKLLSSYTATKNDGTKITGSYSGGSINVSTYFTISNSEYTLTFNNIQSAPSAFFLLFDNDTNNHGLWINNHCVTSISYDGTTTTALAMGDTMSYSATQEYYTFASGELTWSYSNSQHKLTFNIDTYLSYFFEYNANSNYGYRLYYV